MGFLWLQDDGEGMATDRQVENSCSFSGLLKGNRESEHVLMFPFFTKTPHAQVEHFPPSRTQPNSPRGAVRFFKQETLVQHIENEFPR